MKQVSSLRQIDGSLEILEFSVYGIFFFDYHCIFYADKVEFDSLNIKIV